jgi:hypothetical protein
MAPTKSTATTPVTAWKPRQKRGLAALMPIPSPGSRKAASRTLGCEEPYFELPRIKPGFNEAPDQRQGPGEEIDDKAGIATARHLNAADDHQETDDEIVEGAAQGHQPAAIRGKVQA